MHPPTLGHPGSGDAVEDGRVRFEVFRVRPKQVAVIQESTEVSSGTAVIDEELEVEELISGGS
jgi:hypothetical protein